MTNDTRTQPLGPLFFPKFGSKPDPDVTCIRAIVDDKVYLLRTMEGLILEGVEEVEFPVAEWTKEENYWTVSAGSQVLATLSAAGLSTARVECYKKLTGEVTQVRFVAEWDRTISERVENLVKRTLVSTTTADIQNG